jgi:hypothetical protein
MHTQVWSPSETSIKPTNNQKTSRKREGRVLVTLGVRHEARSTCAFRHHEHDFERSKKTRMCRSSTEILYARVALIMVQLIQQTACENSVCGQF